jgi:hypothetical protein
LIQAESTRTGTTVPNGVVASEATSGEPTEVAAAEGASPSFVHRATEENSRADYAYVRPPAIDGDPDAVVLASVSAGREDAGAEPSGHNIGVWCDFADRRQWPIFNQDRAAVPAGAAFGVVLPRRPKGSSTAPGPRTPRATPPTLTTR